MTSSAEPWRLSATEAAALLASRDLSAVDLLSLIHI